METIVVAVDGSESARQGLQKATELARDISARLHLVHVAPISLGELLRPEGVLGTDPMLLRQVEERLEERGRGVLKQAFEQASGAGVPVTTELLLGHPGSGICEAAESNKAAYVVVGSHGRSRWRQLLLGSVSRFVVEHCGAPVVVVRTKNY